MESCLRWIRRVGFPATIAGTAVGPIPHKPGEKLTANLQVQANGNQRFVVPITLAYGAQLLTNATGLQEQAEAPIIHAAVV